MDRTLLDLFSMLRDAVRYAPPGARTCDRLQTWRVLQSANAPEVATDNLGATICDKGKPYFWSRLWHEKGYNPNGIKWQFPLLYAFERTHRVAKPFDAQPKATFNIEVGVVDVLKPDKDAQKCTGCNARTINEVYQDTNRLLFSALRYISQGIYATVEGGPVDPQDVRLYHKGFLDWSVAQGKITSYDRKGGLLDLTLPKVDTASLYRVGRGEEIYGSTMVIDFIGSTCTPVDYDFTPLDFGVVSQEAGCSNCR